MTTEDFLTQHLDDSLDELKRLVAVPSVAAQNRSLPEGAELVASMLRRRGFAVQILPTGGSPVVVAERAGRSERTLLFYNHYDVQPAEPLELWDSPPFEPEVRGGRLYGRGASDDKGHFVARLHALDALLAQGELPCRVKFLVEGEEEVGSPHLPPFIRDHQELLKADACIWEFGAVDADGPPVQHLGMRGIYYVQLSVRTAQNDAHSGTTGSLLPNAAWRLVWALASLKGPDERIRIPGWYDGVDVASALDLALLDRLPDPAEAYRAEFGNTAFLKGMTGGLELKRAEVFEPTATINGLTSGYQGAGPKTIVPALASAKVDFRLLPGQTIERCDALLRQHLRDQGFGDVEVQFLGGGPAARTQADHPFIALVNQTAERVFGHAPRVAPLVGGSGPNHPFIHVLGLPVAMAGLSGHDDKYHQPNESISLQLYLKHARHMALLLQEFGAGRG